MSLHCTVATWYILLLLERFLEFPSLHLFKCEILLLRKKKLKSYWENVPASLQLTISDTTTDMDMEAEVLLCLSNLSVFQVIPTSFAACLLQQCLCCTAKAQRISFLAYNCFKQIYVHIDIVKEKAIKAPVLQLQL